MYVTDGVVTLGDHYGGKRLELVESTTTCTFACVFRSFAEVVSTENQDGRTSRASDVARMWLTENDVPAPFRRFWKNHATGLSFPIQRAVDW